MKTKELQKLSKEFSEFLKHASIQYYDLDLELNIEHFWVFKFGVQNKKKQQELLNFWLKN